MIKKILKKIDCLIGDIIAGIIIANCFNSASHWQRMKWRIEDLLMKVGINNYENQ